ncbi:MAG TPA: LacI family DNA-binding transcriptional regulator [Chitinophaga sp.]
MRKKALELTGVKEIARRANVSIGTVDRVLHNRKGVSEKTKEKINSIITELGYTPNKMASLLAKKKVLAFAALLPRASRETDYWTYPLDGIHLAHAEIEQFGIHLNIHFYDLNVKASFRQEAGKLLKTLPDGLILAPSFVDESIEFISKVKEKGIPIVFINSDIPHQEPLSYIGPDLFQSGKLSAQLISFMLQPHDEMLIVNISTALENDHHLRRKELGFRRYFEEHALANKITTLDIKGTAAGSIETAFLRHFRPPHAIRAVFVTNSRVSQVAQIIKKHRLDVLLIGYDFLKENIKFLSENLISFLICQRPKEQGYLAVMTLYHHLFHIGTVEPAVYMPIDIITRENFIFYKA